MPRPCKIVVIGPESTGKSTLSAALATVLDTAWNPEYAREYLDVIKRPYTEEDLLQIAGGQLAKEDDLLTKAKDYLICDTDLYVLKVWGESRYGRCHQKILEAIAIRPYDLYLLTYPDMVWTPDPYREHPLEADRAYFYHQYRDIVQQSGIPWVDIRGNAQQRLGKALEAIREMKAMNSEGSIAND